MGEKQDKNIVINDIVGGDSGQLLMGCYFTRHGNTYNFYDSDGNEKGTDIKVNDPFHFKLDGHPEIDWTLAITNPVGPDKLLGSWTDNVDPTLADGSYQAEAGGTGEEEEGDANAASAGGY